MKAYVEFSNTRKSLIAHIKALITDPENMRPPRDQYGYRAKKIFFADYVLYAVARGADWKKTSHLVADGSPNAKEQLVALRDALSKHIDKGLATESVPHRWARYVGKDADQLELLELVKAALVV
jgi:hypothetical protein